MFLLQEESKQEVVKEPSAASKQEAPSIDPKIAKELEELRKFKAKVEEDKKKDVVVSDSFFGKDNSIVKQHRKKYNKFWEELMAQGFPYKEE